jgi:prophage DNA circulation protein
VRYAEFNGYTPPEFHITAILHGTGLLAQFSALKAALNRPGPGTLKHPWYGSQYVAVVGPWKVSRDDKDSGVLHLDIKFAVTSGSMFPASVSGIAATVTALATGGISTVAGNLGGVLSSLVAASGGLSAATSAVLGHQLSLVAAQMLEAFGGVEGVAAAAGAMSRSPERYAAGGDLLTGALTTMMRGPFEDLSVPGAVITSGLGDLYGTFADAAVRAAAIAPVTLDYEVRRTALAEMALNGMALATIASAEAMAGTTFVSAEAVHAAEQSLVAMHTGLASFHADTGIELVLPAVVAQPVAETVAAALEVLRSQEFRLPRLDTLEVFEMPASALAYYLYGTFDRTQTIVDLNLGQNPVVLEESASVLMDVAA